MNQLAVTRLMRGHLRFGAGRTRRRSLLGAGCALRLAIRLFRSRFFGCGFLGTRDFHIADHVTFGDRITLFDGELQNLALEGAWHVHGGLVRLQSDQRVFDVNFIASGNTNFDNRHVRRARQIRHANLFAFGLAAAALFFGRIVFGVGRLVSGGRLVSLLRRVRVVGIVTFARDLHLANHVAFGNGVALFHR